MVFSVGIGVDRFGVQAVVDLADDVAPGLEDEDSFLPKPPVLDPGGQGSDPS